LFRAVIFDYGGVLTTSPFAGLEMWDAKMGLPVGSLREALFGDYHAGDGGGLVPQLERGEITIADFTTELAGLFADVAREPSGDQGDRQPLDFGRLLGSYEFGVHWMMVARARRLRDEGYRVGLLTNNVKEYGDAWRATIPVDIFDDIVDSSVVGVRKPDARIFLMAAERLGVTPPQCVFLDDVASNVEGAQAVGMAGILVDSPWAAIEELDRVLASAENSDIS
jgi:epoxide hydrolase-like predicted phosphatase